jgi:hypothetical protein
MVDVKQVLDLEQALKLLAADAAVKVERFREYTRELGKEELAEIWNTSGHDPLVATKLIYKRYTTEESPDKSFVMKEIGFWTS